MPLDPKRPSIGQLYQELLAGGVQTPLIAVSEDATTLMAWNQSAQEWRPLTPVQQQAIAPFIAAHVPALPEGERLAGVRAKLLSDTPLSDNEIKQLFRFVLRRIV